LRGDFIRNVIAIGERAGRYSSHIDQHCSHYGAVENDQHLFFKCELPQQVWSTTTHPVHTNNIPTEIDGIQITLPLLFTPNPTEDNLCKILFTLWYIWKAHNDHRFQRTTWPPLQVHHTAIAHMHIHLTAIKEQQQNHHSQTEDQITTTATHQTGMPLTFVGSSTILQQQTHDSLQHRVVGPAQDGTNATQQHSSPSTQETCQDSHPTTSVIESMLIPFPTSIRGTRCYTDA